MKVLSMDEYLQLTLISHLNEAKPAFSARLSQFWTHMLRNQADTFEKVYAETTAFESRAGRLERHYLIESEALAPLEQELSASGIEHAPVDPEETFSRYEASSPDWMQIEH